MRTLLAGATLVAILSVAGCVSQGPARQQSAMDQALQDHIQLGFGYLGEGNREAARFHLRKALEIDKNSPGAHNGMALLYQMQLENELAEKHYRKAIALDKGFSSARNNFGVFLFQQQRFEEAYEQFAAAAADTGYNLRAQAYLSQGIVARRLDRPDEAVQAWRKAVALDPNLAGAYLELARFYFDNGDYPRSREMLQKYDRLGKPQPQSLWLAVRLEHRFGNRDAMASKGLALEKLFPYSKENLEYQKWLKNDRSK
jgi:type IV pilus assembly protein PilF